MATLIVVAIVMLYPFFFIIQSAFRSSTQFLVGDGFSLSSWRLLFDTLPVPRQLLNSTLVTGGAIVLILAASSTAGFAFAKLRYKGSMTLFLVVVASMMVPMQSIIIPEFVNLSRLGMINQLHGAILVYAALGIPFGTFLMTTYFQSMPDELIDAAVVDGATYFGIFTRIMIPMAVPALVAIAVLQFIQVWGDLLIGLLFLQTPAVRTITVGLATLHGSHVTQLPVVMAGSLISAAPAAAVYLIFQRHIIAGLTLGMGK